jgi:thioredoxin-related protein
MRLHLLKFESKVCGACIGMNKKGVIDTLSREFPEMEVTTLVIADEHGESPPGSAYEESYEISDDYEVSQLPTFVLTDEFGNEVGRIEGTETLTNFRKAIGNVIEGVALDAKRFARVQKFKASQPLLPG